MVREIIAEGVKEDRKRFAKALKESLAESSYLQQARSDTGTGSKKNQ